MLGGGHGALATAADLAARGFHVRLALRNRARFGELFETGRITLSGAAGEHVGVPALVTEDHAAAARGADMVLLPLPAYAQEPVAVRIAGAVAEGALVVLLPGNWGSAALAPLLPGAVFAETATLPYGARQRGQAGAQVALVAHHNPTGVHPPAQAVPALRLLRRLYPACEPARDVLDAALLNSNGSLHAPLVVLNAGPIERLGEYDIHVEGTTPGVRRVMAALDAERVAIRERLGYGPPHWPLMAYYADADWFYGPGAFSRVQRTSVWRERLAFEHRYLTEDVAYGLALWASLGRAARLPMPLTEAFIALASVLAGRDLYATGRTLESLGASLDRLPP